MGADPEDLRPAPGGVFSDRFVSRAFGTLVRTTYEVREGAIAWGAVVVAEDVLTGELSARILLFDGR